MSLSPAEWETVKRIEHKLDRALQTLGAIQRQGEKIVATQQELTATLARVADELKKVGDETSALVGMVADLQAQIASGPEVTPELQAAVDRVAAQAKLVDDLVPDVPPAPGPQSQAGKKP